MRTKKMVGIGALALSGLIAAGGAALLGSPGPAGAQSITAAQQSGTYAASVHQLFGEVEQELNLTRHQRALIKAILQKAVPQGRALYNNQSLPAEQKRARLQALRVAIRAKLQQVLTPTQRRKISALQNGAQERGRVLLHKLAKDLQLTPAQQTQLKPVLQKTFAEVKDLHNDMSLTIPQKLDRLHQIHIARRSEVNAVLTPAQEKKLTAIIGEIAMAVRSEIMQRIKTHWSQ
jgi:Spy/CpxP family protein refolding chaperone